MIPTREKCLELICQHRMLPHIVRHSKLVTEVALLIGRKLNSCGQHLDLSLVEAGALLHDIMKTMSIQTKEDHAQTGGELLNSLGYPAVASIVRQHIRVDKRSFEPDGVVSEEELVNYADKRVKHEELVDIEERFQDIQERYANKFPGLQESLEEVRLETQLLEQKIFSNLDISPKDLGALLAKSNVQM